MASTQTQAFNDFNLPTDGYAAFDALSLKNLIINRLNANNILTDQNYEGSNLSSIIDIIAYSYHVLLFYLNRTSAESTFTTAELYENINKIVKLIGYKPIGVQTSILSFQAIAAASLAPGTYTIPRYSYFTINSTRYSINDDVTFTKATNSIEQLSDFQNSNLLYQGEFVEYPTYISNGSPFEVLTLVINSPTGDSIIIDHFNIDVYVRDNTQTTPTWVKWTPTQSLFLERFNSTSYEIRLNENNRYEIKFGNNINGKQLNAGDEVAVYYLKSKGQTGEVGPGLLNGNTLFLYKTARFNTIQTDTTPVNLTLITSSQVNTLTFNNTDPSTPFTERESVDNIRTNSQNTFKGQYRLITNSDFTTFINSNYGNIISSTRVVNNWEYIQEHLKYYFDLGVTTPNTESRVLFNQVKYADSTNFNNVYVYAVPRLKKTNSLTSRVNYLNAAQKQILINDLQSTKLTTTEIIINDPVYLQIDLGVRPPSAPTSNISSNGVSFNPDVLAKSSTLVITRSITAKQNSRAIAQQVANTISNYFAVTKDNLGMLISLTDLSNQILQIGDILKIETVTQNSDGSIHTSPGLSFVAYNPVYPYNDVSFITQDTQLPYFKFPYLNDASNFINKISVVVQTLNT
jgi:hypothetical protein